MKAPEADKTFKSATPIVIQADKPVTTGQAPKKLIFLDFYNEANDPNAKWLTDSIGESIFELTKNKYNYIRIENRLWREYAANKGFKPADFYDIEKLQAMGFAMKVDGIVFGKFKATKDNIVISGKILSVVDKDIVAEKNITVPYSSQMFEDVQDVSETLGSRIKDLFYPSDRGALWRSALLPGWGQHYKQRKTWGYIYNGTIGTGLAFTLFSFILWQKANGDSNSYKPDHVVTPQGEYGIKDPAAARAQFAVYAARSEQWEEITMIAGGITLTIYLWHLFDAWFFEGSYVQLGKGNAMGRFDAESLLGANVRITGDREPLSVRIGYAF